MTWVALGALASSAGCTRDADLVEVAYYTRWGDATARVWIPVDEPRSMGTYRAEVSWPDGTTGHIRGERDGMIAEVWLTDLGSDGALELVIALTSAGSGSYGSVHVHRRRGDALVPVPVAPLDDPVPAGYMGHDTFSVEGGRLYRTFPVYAEGDPNASPSGGSARFRYSFAEGRWITEGHPEE
jgi:hypothetical protein